MKVSAVTNEETWDRRVLEISFRRQSNSNDLLFPLTWTLLSGASQLSAFHLLREFLTKESCVILSDRPLEASGTLRGALIGKKVYLISHAVLCVFSQHPLSRLPSSDLMTLGAIFTPTLAAELKISLGSCSQSAYLRRSQLFFTRQVLLTSARPVRLSFLPLPQRCCYLIRALFVTFYWFLQVWWE